MKEEKRKNLMRASSELARTMAPFAKIGGEFENTMAPFARTGKELARTMAPFAKIGGNLAETIGPFAVPKRPFLEAMEPFTAKPAVRLKTETPSHTAHESEILELKKQIAGLKRQVSASHTAHESEILELKKQVADLRGQVREKERPPKPPKPPWHERVRDRNLEMVKLLPKILWRLAPLGAAIGWWRKILELLQREPAEVGQL